MQITCIVIWFQVFLSNTKLSSNYIDSNECMLSIMVIMIRNAISNSIQILDKAICVSL